MITAGRFFWVNQGYTWCKCFSQKPFAARCTGTMGKKPKHRFLNFCKDRTRRANSRHARNQTGKYTSTQG